MANLLHKILWRSLLLLALLAAAALRGGVQPTLSGADTSPNPTLTPGPQVIVEEPSLTPVYNGICDSEWSRYTNTRGFLAYLTLNIQSPSSGTNQGVWRPVLPQDGYYRVDAFIPAHGAVDWECPTRHIDWDTSEARYLISNAEGSQIVSKNQAPLNDEWLALGEYAFKAGTASAVTLTDVNGEESASTTVSFSAMRFSWVRPLPPPTQTITHTVYLPNVVTPGVPVSVLSSWTADVGGVEKKAFTPGEAILYRTTGANTTGNPASTHLSWQQTGPCGPTTIFSGTLEIENGTWARQGAGNASGCLGVYTTTLTLKYQRFTTTSISNYVVNNPAVVAVSSQPAFDKCKVPTVEQMQAWWVGSPYRVANIYIGGSLLGCPNLGLDAFWVHSVSRQGWSFIPTWVGPQAPCTGFRERMSSDPATAYRQGRSEASAASDAAIRLGLAGSQVIYYDVEGYQGAGEACRNAVNYFLKGWVERMHEAGGRAGAYGSSCNSFIADWYDISPRPDNVWIASWIGDGYDPDASVWGAPCLPDSLWANHERIRQYAGDHRETWGAVSLVIDSNIVDGETNILPQKLGVAQPFAGEIENTQAAADIRAFQSLPGGQGWVLFGSRLLWRGENNSWKEITPPGVLPLAAHFLDTASGWVAGRDNLTGVLAVWRTGDRGAIWKIALLPGARELASAVESADIHFLDGRAGWLAVKLQSSSSFSQGALFKTKDGGESWTALPLPVAGEVRFSDEMVGWITGGVSGEDAYRTLDGGITWQQEDEAENRANALPRTSLTKLPEGTIDSALADGKTAWALTQEGKCEGNKETPTFQCELRTGLWETTDGGDTWSPMSIPLD